MCISFGIDCIFGRPTAPKSSREIPKRYELGYRKHEIYSVWPYQGFSLRVPGGGPA